MNLKVNFRKICCSASLAPAEAALFRVFSPSRFCRDQPFKITFVLSQMRYRPVSGMSLTTRERKTT